MQGLSPPELFHIIRAVMDVQFKKELPLTPQLFARAERFRQGQVDFASFVQFFEGLDRQSAEELVFPLPPIFPLPSPLPSIFPLPSSVIGEPRGGRYSQSQ